MVREPTFVTRRPGGSRQAPDARTPTGVVGVLDIGDAGVWGWN